MTHAHAEPTQDREAAASAAGPSVARPTGGPIGAPGLLALQRTAGNRAVGAALQRRTAPPAPAPAQAPTQAAGPGEAEPVVQTGVLDDLAGGVRDRALGTLRDTARRMPGYDLLCTVIGRDVITGAAVARTGAALVSGFLALIPGSERIRQNLQESGAIDKAGQWLDMEVPKLGLSFDAIAALFRTAWDRLGASDLLDPIGAFQKIAGVFAAPVALLKDFAIAAGKKLLEFVFEGALAMAGSAGTMVMGIIRRAGGVFDQIMANPIGFAGNLVSAVRGGLSAFLTNIGTHLKNGLIGWLTGGLAGVIRIPAKFDLMGIVGMVLDFLGITWHKVKGKLGQAIGPDVLELLETGVDKLQQGAGFIGDLFKRGLSAITDRIAEFAGGLVDQVIGGIRDWVAQSVVGAAITKLISMFNPAGAVIQAIISIYNTVQFFIERAQQLATLASAVFDSIAAIASGNIGTAVQWVEQALGKAVPVVLGFLSRLIGLGDIAGPVRKVMEKVHSVIDSALDKAMAWVAKAAAPIIKVVRAVATKVRAGVDKAKAFATSAVAAGKAKLKGLVSGRRGDQRPADAGGADLGPAVAAGGELLQAPGATTASVQSGLSALRQRFGLRTAELQPGRAPDTFHVSVQRTTAATPDLPLIGAAGGDVELVKTAVTTHGILPVMQAVAAGQKLGTVGIETFRKVWSISSVKAWLKDKFRAATPFHHEWLPSNMILDAIERTITEAATADAAAKRTTDWTVMQHGLRVPTRSVIWNFRLVRGEGIAVGAHVGSFMAADAVAKSVGTKGTGEFHDSLRRLFREAASADQFLAGLHAFVQDRVWDGSGIPGNLRNETIGDYGLAYYIDDTDATTDVRLGHLGDQQREEKARMLRTIAEMRAQLRG